MPARFGAGYSSGGRMRLAVEKIEFTEVLACHAQLIQATGCIDHLGKQLRQGDVGIFEYSLVEARPDLLRHCCGPTGEHLSRSKLDGGVMRTLKLVITPDMAAGPSPVAFIWHPLLDSERSIRYATIYAERDVERLTEWRSGPWADAPAALQAKITEAIDKRLEWLAEEAAELELVEKAIDPAALERISEQSQFLEVQAACRRRIPVVMARMREDEDYLRAVYQGRGMRPADLEDRVAMFRATEANRRRMAAKGEQVFVPAEL